jgi:hypothetical protein
MGTLEHGSVRVQSLSLVLMLCELHVGGILLLHHAIPHGAIGDCDVAKVVSLCILLKALHVLVARAPLDASD